MKPAQTSSSIVDFQFLNELIVSGKLAQCREFLLTLNPRTTSDEHREKLAELSIRSSLPLLALKFLHTLLQPHFQYKVTNSSRILYARALYQLGAGAEALEILNTVDVKLEPEVLFWRACASMYTWDYESAYKYLNSYGLTQHGNLYRQHVVQVNKVACLINSESYSRARELISSTQISCAKNGFDLLLGNLYELEAQISIFTADFKNAEAQLLQAKNLLQDQGALYGLYVNKWASVLALMRSPDAESIQMLQVVRQQAIELSHWSTLRECDFFEAVVCNKQELLKKVYWGSPVSSYRKRIRKHTQSSFNLNEEYRLRFAIDENKFDYFVFNPAEKLLENKTLYSLFGALTEDFYQPKTLTELFKKVYSDEKFNPFTSVSRVMRLLVRLNKWLEVANVPVRARIKKSEFMLVATNNIEIRICNSQKTPSRMADAQFNNLLHLLREKTISTQAIAKHLKISAAGVQRLLKKALDEGRVLKIGNGRSSLYRAVVKHEERMKEAA